MPWSVETIIQSGGLLAIFLIIFSESGLFFGILFPGDSLLLAAGFLAGQELISIYWLIPLVVTAAVLGDNVGYYIGHRLGPHLFKREDGILFRREYIKRTSEFYDKHGGKTIIIARFFPVIRTFAPVVAGVGKMSWKRFAFFNVIGAFMWGCGLPLIGYSLGRAFPEIDKYFLWFLFITAQVTLIIIIWHVLGDAKRRKNLRQGLAEEFHYFFGRRR
ncbi:hypothetical protein A3E49_00895 [Candidatus Saccharibacteria bacterium RIFCSPHIGHO2_12_FULL_49_19]|nr:MAG: hypothetical protein A2708_01375 [Candidatus Saccharibacteria bacterium RIFCSPHIGHO2_01_FULL_49_21]OGL36718.1 MAG: hypothetical protein A3E49_00895 [Candidatus Saccharibacteria bacterium RIFCSPHIGHO2_12_FULL_49_19]OGL37971.1 MAG: hypothetical protein A3B63_01455 [Candidatus Saccharibacteria bacterium RIFCSPLOWO2_01_FULL_49_22]